MSDVWSADVSDVWIVGVSVGCLECERFPSRFPEKIPEQGSPTLGRENIGNHRKFIGNYKEI